MVVDTTGRTRMKIIPVATIMTPGLLLVNTMKKRIKILFFFVRFYLLTSWPQCGIIVVGQRALDGRQGPNFRSHTPYAKFLRLLATFHMRPIFPENRRGPIGSPYAILI